MTTTGEVDSAAGGEDLEPLFDYKRVQPRMTFSFDDSDLEAADIFKHCNKRPRVQATTEEVETKPDEAAATTKVVLLDEEDWLKPPPPKAAFRASAEEDSTFRELRLKRQEWAKFAESAQDILQKMDEMTNNEVGPKEPPEQIILDEESEPPVEKAREKIVISIQDKDGHQQMRVYKDEKFDKLLKVYANKAKLNPSDLSFVFDGEKINPSSTPQDLDLEDEDMIEVRRKRS
ncbi:hypothetical protein BDA96_03G232000 [Sorghum bicolor]|uniref:Rad60/SUMO-like domain-containing protein n=2 Tax=Sorghum bicolor TaxID=4558 RepID=A0A921UQU9_SORBI|nr:uncharacterized protein LOC8082229 [Sorghum bicolor]KAG0538391.1 hypothetical protein BDA96_03G232000 [Sorghum bicolor]KXG32852.1 hypothetical protein SORBI_3003G214500 [Sorghum bicolor]|eukprot:XP_021313636.1 uncharacterized protein LOC8082229 [Sorghum bicolor]